MPKKIAISLTILVTMSLCWCLFSANTLPTAPVVEKLLVFTDKPTAIFFKERGSTQKIRLKPWLKNKKGGYKVTIPRPHRTNIYAQESTSYQLYGLKSKKMTKWITAKKGDKSMFVTRCLEIYQKNTWGYTWKEWKKSILKSISRLTWGTTSSVRQGEPTVLRYAPKPVTFQAEGLAVSNKGHIFEQPDEVAISWQSKEPIKRLSLTDLSTQKNLLRTTIIPENNILTNHSIRALLKKYDKEVKQLEKGHEYELKLFLPKKSIDDFERPSYAYHFQIMSNTALDSLEKELEGLGLE